MAIDFGDIENRNIEHNWPRLVLLAADESGYRSLMRLCSRAYLETAAQERPHLRISWLDETTDGLIALSGGPNGPLDGAIVAGRRPVASKPARAAAMGQGQGHGHGQGQGHGHGHGQGQGQGQGQGHGHGLFFFFFFFFFFFKKKKKKKKKKKGDSM